ncbi:MMPL family transporter [Streptomyces sp. 3MP-14]|uniref:MMPL family transporter n=1 Tax=Streptomyces mimosae TaxID=2586635 RepID=A0A5N6AFN6_9ACTN|nr:MULTISPECIES: MMPL family transporter [Streptomyces]KAB8166982.1 MMPL family transporter [Streptomyces mimosae]KAB8176923.1 MMPL family transporter [Streptomyces sp. 3MP-14]
MTPTPQNPRQNQPPAPPADHADHAAPPGRPPRPSVFARVARFAFRHRVAALGLWVLVLVGVWTLASAVGDDYREDYSLPGTESQHALELLEEHGSGRGGDTVEIVLHSEDGLAGAEPEVAGMLAEVEELPRVVGVFSPYDDPSALSDDGTVGYATVLLDTPAEQMTVPDTERILGTAREVADDGLQVELGGDAARKLGESEGGSAEGIGILAALVILVFMFGSVIAAGLPVITALFAVGSTLGAIVLASHLFTIADYTMYVMMLVGLGVGIDYALLIFTRYRAELVAGATPERATVRALDAAGRTVFFAGCTVIVALLGLVALGLGSLQGSAVSVALTVLATMLGSLTLLPALLGIFGKRFARHFTARAAKRARRGRPAVGAGWRRLGGAVQRRPLAALTVAVVALLALAAPALSLRLGMGDAGNDPADATSRKAYDLLSEGFGPGFNGPLVVVTDGGASGAEAAAGAAAERLDGVEGVAGVTPPAPTEDGAIATLVVFPDSSPQDEATSELVHELRDSVLPALGAETGADYLVGGATAATQDYVDKVAERMPLFVAIVVGVSVLLLMAVFRSVWIPIKAALLNLLSIGAALGAMTLVFQEGWFGVEPGPIEAYLPVMIFAIVFGLSMDYEIFLVSRMHEEWERHRDHQLAVREGLAHTGAVISAAGAIMVVVFGAFMFSPDRMLQQMGFGMAVAILVDAVVIRCLIVPAAMQLLGRHAWWLPAPLARLLPKVELEQHEDAPPAERTEERAPARQELTPHS